MSVVSMYAPTTKASPGVKAKFTDELQDTLDHVPADDILIVLGDFNACVGKSEGNRDVWREVRGRHGIRRGDEAGEKHEQPHHHEHLL